MDAERSLPSGLARYTIRHVARTCVLRCKHIRPVTAQFSAEKSSRSFRRQRDLSISESLLQNYRALEIYFTVCPKNYEKILRRDQRSIDVSHRKVIASNSTLKGAFEARQKSRRLQGILKLIIKGTQLRLLHIVGKLKNVLKLPGHRSPLFSVRIIILCKPAKSVYACVT